MKTARLAWWLSGLAALAALVYLMATASTGPVDPTEVTQHQSHATVVFNSSMIVFREGLEAVLIFAAVTASFLGANRSRRRPVVVGALCAFGAAVATWFVVQAVLDAASSLGPRLEAISGFAATLGLVALGFTSVYREGFEVVLFLQNLELQAGSGTVLEGVLLGLAGTAVVGVFTFWLHHKLPYKKMLVLTGVLVGVVLVVMIGGTALSFQDLGWLPKHETPFTLPEWMGSWFEMYSTWETLGVQLVAALFVIGSYFLAKEVKVNRPQRHGARPAVRLDAPPAERDAAEPVLGSGLAA
jgi:high-affinity iron transporter